MELYPNVGSRPNETTAQWTTRAKWARLAQVNWFDRNSVDMLRSITASSIPNWSIDANITYWCGSSLQYTPPARLGRTDVPPWEYLGDKVPEYYKPIVVPQLGSSLRSNQDYSMGLKLDLPRGSTPAWSVKPVLPPRNDILDLSRAADALQRSTGHDLYANLTGSSAFGLTLSMKKYFEEQGTALTQILPMRAGNVVKWLKRGGTVLWENKRYVVKYGSKILGPLGALGTAKDMYDFIVWVNEKGVFDEAKSKPRAEYNPSNGNLEYHHGDGTVTAGLPKMWNPRLENPGMFS